MWGGGREKTLFMSSIQKIKEKLLKIKYLPIQKMHIDINKQNFEIGSEISMLSTP